MSGFNLADLWEAVAPQVADRTALVCGGQRRTYRELTSGVNRLARWLADRGIGPGDHVAIAMPNRVEWIEAFLGALTLRAVPVNLNHRYTASELAPVLERDGTRAVVFDTTTSVELTRALNRVPVPVRANMDDPDLRLSLDALPDGPLQVEGRSGDDHYVIYTGGTTGLPKGVVWRQEDAFFTCFGGGDPMRMQGPVPSPDEVPNRIVPAMSYLPVAPLMHAAAQWTTVSWLLSGGQTTLMPGSLDPEAVWQAVEDEAVNAITVVGDAVGKPLADVWDAHPGRWNVASLLVISNGGAPMSAALKARLAATFPAITLIDGFGSSETGAQGAQRLGPDDAGRADGRTRFAAYADTAVLDDDRRPIEPGSEVIGRVALRGRVPIGYHNDPEGTAATFVEIDGGRWVITGDLARVEADGTVALLGRGSQCINTGGEKVFPEEVEGVLHGHPAVADVLVVGVDDERWGSAVTAVVQPAGDATDAIDPDELRAHCRTALAGYKVPKHVVVVDRVRRSPAGKANYRWAAEAARRSLQV